MDRTELNFVDSYNLNNCFGFGDDDIDLTIWNNSSVMNSTMAPVEFQQNKPYRLALYARPTERRRNNVVKNAFTVLKNANQKLNQKKEESKIVSSVKNSSQVKNKKNVKKANSVMLFDENVKPPNDSTNRQERPSGQTKLEDYSIGKCPNSSKKNILTEVNCKPVAKSKQYKIRKSYERKCKEKDVEIVPERPSNEIIKELEIKQLTRTKPKKPGKEDKEFEKWASDLNSDFDDVDKFELSIAYD